MKTATAITVGLMSLLPPVVMAQQGSADQRQTQQQMNQEQRQSTSGIGPVQGDREFTISGSGNNDKDFDNGSFSVVGDWGWYYQANMLLGFRQSVNYANIEGENLTDDFWNGATRGFINYLFMDPVLDARFQPFAGGSLGFVYGDGTKDSGFAGLELGGRYYVLDKTFLLARVEYQWFFSSGDDEDGFSDGAYAHTIGVGYNF